MISKHATLKELLTDFPNIIDTLLANGFKGLENKHVLQEIGDTPLEDLLRHKKIDVLPFLKLLNDSITNDYVDISLREKKHTKNNLTLLGILPCSVKTEIIEKFSALEDSKNFNYTLKASSAGTDWIRDTLAKNTLADLYISAGFRLFFDDVNFKALKKDNIFKDLHSDAKHNTDFSNTIPSFRDPKGIHTLYGVVTAVFVINSKIFQNKKPPKTWEDLLDPKYENMIALPSADSNLFSAILLYIYKEFGEIGLIKLKQNLFSSSHPSQIVKSLKRVSARKPAISILPYFFTQIIKSDTFLEIVWPLDGAISAPLFFLAKKEKAAELKKITNFFMSKEIGEIVSQKGFSPSVHKDVDNGLNGKRLKWIGWDYIYANDIGAILDKYIPLFDIKQL